MKNNWALIGSGGFIAPRHRKAIEEVGDKLILTCDINLGSSPDFYDWRAMMASSEWKKITHVAICTPNDLHYEMCREMEDKIALCEKPLTLSSRECLSLGENVFTVLQLRHSPVVAEIKKKIAKQRPKFVEMFVKVKRDAKILSGWKGDEKRSGGVLFSLGIHYLDLLLYLFGAEYNIIDSTCTERLATGAFFLRGVWCRYHFEIADTVDQQDRRITIDGQPFSLSKADNLSFENLHTKVYGNLVWNGQNVDAGEAMKSIRLIEELKLRARLNN